MIINLSRIAVVALLISGLMSEGASREYCYRNNLYYNSHTKLCCPQGQVYASESKKCCPNELYERDSKTCKTPVLTAPVQTRRVRRGPALLPKRHENIDYALNKKTVEL